LENGPRENPAKIFNRITIEEQGLAESEDHQLHPLRETGAEG
jgi:hypothetical protein